MKKHWAERLAAKRAAWLERSARALGIDGSGALPLLHTGRKQSLRLNPLRGEPAETIAALKTAGWTGKQYAWMGDGLTIGSPLEPVRDSQPVQDGRAFIQNAASWLPVL